MLCVDLEAHPDGNKLGKLEESALHPTSPFVLERGVPQVFKRFEWGRVGLSSLIEFS